MRSSTLLVVVALLAGCGFRSPTNLEDDITPDLTDPALERQCDLGLVRDDVYIDPAEDDRAELLLGFQGFLFFRARVRAEAPAQGEVTAKMSLALPERSPANSVQPRTGLSPWGDAGAETEDLLVFMQSASLADFVGKRGELVARVEGDDWWCVVVQDVELIDEDPCLHTYEAPLCPD